MASVVLVARFASMVVALALEGMFGGVRFSITAAEAVDAPRRPKMARVEENFMVARDAGVWSLESGVWSLELMTRKWKLGI